MARRTRLALIAEEPGAGDDQRPVHEAFPAPPPPIPPNSQRAEDVLMLLRRDTDRALAIASDAGAVASSALEAAQRSAADTTTLATATETLVRRTDGIAAEARGIEERTAAALAGQAQAQAHAARAGAVALATVAQQAVALLIQCLVYLIDRAPVLIALAAAVWLWARVLDDPTTLRLVALGLFGALVIAPAMWFSAFRRGGSNAG